MRASITREHRLEGLDRAQRSEHGRPLILRPHEGAQKYMAYGGIESDYRPARWGSFREPYKFSGKEEDIEVGLSYFGARYYSTALGRWMSPDAVTIHDLKGDANPYAYVHGSPLMGVDPDGNFAQMAIGAIVGAVVSTVTQLAVNGSVDWKEVAISAAVGAITGGVGSLLGGGAVAGAGAAMSSSGGGVLAGVATGMVGSAANSILHGESISAKSLALGALSGGVSGGVSGVAGASNAASSIGVGAVGSAASYVAVSGATGQRVSASGLGMAAGSGGFSSAVSVGVGAAYSAIKSVGQAERVAVGSGKAKAKASGGPDLAVLHSQMEAEGKAFLGGLADNRVGGPGGGDSSADVTALEDQLIANSESEPGMPDAADPIFDKMTEANIGSLRAELQPLAREHIFTLRQAGVDARITQGTRTFKEQQDTYNQGRTTPGPIVTNAKPGHSPHNVEAAYDMAIFRNGVAVGHETKTDMPYSVLGLAAAPSGVDWGPSIPGFPKWDVGHYQLPNYQSIPNLVHH